jgi:hypothetical protein
MLMLWQQQLLLPVAVVTSLTPPASLISGLEISKMGGSDGGRDICRI